METVAPSADNLADLAAAFPPPFVDDVKVTVTATIVSQMRWSFLTVELFSVDAATGVMPVPTASHVLSLVDSAMPLVRGTHQINVSKTVRRMKLNEDPGGEREVSRVDHFGIVGEVGVFRPFADEFRARLTLVSGWEPFAEKRIAWTAVVVAPPEPVRGIINGDVVPR